MRFKKLKTFVGISLVVFILVVGSIIAFGYLSQHHDDNEVLILTPVYSGSKATTSSGTVTTTTQTTTQPTVVHTIRTRAS